MWLPALVIIVQVDSQADIDEILGTGITPASFENFDCDATAANARCYTTMSKFKSDPLDSCEKNLVNTKSSQTIGDYLCQQVTVLLTNTDVIIIKENSKEGGLYWL